MVTYDGQKVILKKPIKTKQILKMSVLENFLLESIQFLYQNGAGVVYYSYTQNLESNDTKGVR